jgi:hypothetical protein
LSRTPDSILLVPVRPVPRDSSSPDPVHHGWFFPEVPPWSRSKTALPSSQHKLLSNAVVSILICIYEIPCSIPVRGDFNSPFLFLVQIHQWASAHFPSGAGHRLGRIFNLSGCLCAGPARLSLCLFYSLSNLDKFISLKIYLEIKCFIYENCSEKCTEHEYGIHTSVCILHHDAR